VYVSGNTALRIRLVVFTVKNCTT